MSTLIPIDIEDAAELSLDLADRAKPLFAGHHPGIVGGALADLLATWLAGHPAEKRDDLLESHITYVLELIPICEDEIRGDAPSPEVP